jgi:N-hydroxyarylamine O-acetyltransferase
VDAEYEICNWFTASHPDSPYRSNLIAARPGPNRTRITMFNARVNVRHPNGEVERRTLQDTAEYREVLSDVFGVSLSDADLHAALATVERKGTRGPPHPFFA